MTDICRFATYLLDGYEVAISEALASKSRFRLPTPIHRKKAPAKLMVSVTAMA